MSSHNFNGGKSLTNPTSYNYDCVIRAILYFITSYRICLSPFCYSWLSIWIHFLCRHRFPWITRNYRNILYLGNNYSTNKIPLLLKTPLWVWSESLILTFCRCSMIIFVYLYLLVRVLRINKSKHSKPQEPKIGIVNRSYN